MVNRMAVLVVSLTVFLVLAGCATKGDLAALDSRMRGEVQDLRQLTTVLQEGQQQSRVRLEEAGERIEGLSVEAGRLESDLASQKGKLDEVINREEEIASGMKSLQEGLQKLQGDLQTMIGDVGEAKSGMEKVSQQADKVQGRMGALESKVGRFTDEFDQLRSSVKQAQELFIKNLEAARDMARQQFLALEEILATSGAGGAEEGAAE